MTVLIILLAQIFIPPLLTRAETCENILNVGACTFTDENRTVLSITTDEKACNNFSNVCCWDGKLCYNKFKSPPDLNATIVDDGKENETIFELPDLSQARRTLQVGLPCLVPTAPQEFPMTCSPKRNEPYVMEPPLDIPYCMRIPCTSDNAKQSQLDQSNRECGVQPGCYFDSELFRFRQTYGDSVLAGVPVCQLAIQTSTFHKHAQKVVEKYGFWNPYFTYCLLTTFEDEINEEHPGCKLIPVILAFKVQPKLKGWADINSRQCRLIEGCWRPGEGCFSPVNSNQVTVKSGQLTRASVFEVRYGRSKCQHFNSENPYETVKSYHRCLSAGCAVDTFVADFYYDYLFALGYQMSIQNHWGFWNDVLQGKISTIYDLKTMKWKQDPKVSLNSSVSSKECSFLKSQHLRPCRPLRPPPLPSNKFCQYQPPNSSILPPLKGSFKGCCDINQCYHPKNDFSKSQSGPSVYYTEWSYFTQCTASCGRGVTRKRFRKCVSHDSDLCTEELEQTVSCNLPRCGRWSKWSSWGECVGNGNKGTMKKTRTCLPKGSTCRGSPERKRRCQCRQSRG